MIISEKQIMNLLTIARTYAENLRQQGMVGEINSYKVMQLIDQINTQQSEKLREVKE